MKVCPKCGGRSFYAHQECRINVIVDGDNTFKENAGETADECIYDSEEPYGPYCCVKCGEEFQSLDLLKEQK